MRITTIVASFAMVFTVMACQSVDDNQNQVVEVLEQYSDLDSMINARGDELWVVNFWATSCPPCIKEMPHFKELEEHADMADANVLLVSLDQAHDLDSRVYPFVEKYDITPEVVLLADQNYSAWTDEVDPDWYGALPATIVFKGDKKKFRFGAYESAEELLEDVQSIASE